MFIVLSFHILSWSSQTDIEESCTTHIALAQVIPCLVYLQKQDYMMMMMMMIYIVSNEILVECDEFEYVILPLKC